MCTMKTSLIVCGALTAAIFVAGLRLATSGDTPLATPALAQQKGPPPSREAAQYSFAPIVRKAAPAVVNVYVRSRVQAVNSPFADDPMFRRLFGDRFGQPSERIQSSLGSGVIIDASGIVVTNTHVVKGRGETEIRVALSDKREFDAKVVTLDEKSDIAILKLEGVTEKFPTLEFEDSDSLEVGDLVLAIGNPFGVGQTVTSGIVSALSRSEIGSSDQQVFIQTDAAINPGNSGGALVDVSGHLIGINSAIYSRSGGNQGIGFTIPVSLAKKIMEQIIQKGVVTRGWIGVEVQDVTPELAESFNLGTRQGALIAGVLRNAPADKAGILPGDVVVDIAGKSVTESSSLLNLISDLPPGKSIKIKVIRTQKAMTVEVNIGTRPKQQIERN